MKLKLVEHSSNQFTYVSEKKVFVADASDLDNRHLEKIYDDACDVGFAMKSEKTGKVITFVMESPFHTQTDDERELAGWHYVPTSESFRNVPECQGMEAKIFND